MEHELNEDQAASYASAETVTVVGIGASAGGLEAIEAFFSDIPAEPGCAFIIVQHLPADRKSLMAEILSRHTRLEARVTQDGEPILPNRIYLPPPGSYIRLEQGRLALSKIPSTEVNSWPINMLFTSLARELGDHAIVVVLSGSGSDGMRGCEAVRERNGLVLVQDRITAAFDGMPRSAALVADLVLPPRDLAASVLSYLRREPVAQTPVDVDPETDQPQEALFEAILAIVAGRYNVNFRDYKSEMIYRRIQRRSTLQACASLNGYRDLLVSDDRELARLFKDLLIGVTGFFRDEHVFAKLADAALPKLVEKIGTDNPFRCWVAGCATGEEAYSMAIVIYEALAAAGKPLNFNVFATDVFEPALEIASRGDYEAGQLASMSVERLTRFFVPRVGGYQVSSVLRRHVVFARHDMMHDVAFRRLDLVSCRNVLIYFKPESQLHIMTSLERALNDSGILVLGQSENVGALSQTLIPIDGRSQIFRKRSDNGSRRQPALGSPIGGPVPSGPVSMPQFVGVHPGSTRAGGLADNDLHGSYDILLQRFIKAGVLVDRQGEILHNFGRMERYIRIPVGRMRNNITSLIRTELKTPLQAGMNSALRDQRVVTITDVPLGEGDDRELLEITVEALPERLNGVQHLLITIEAVRHAESGQDDEPLSVRQSRELLLSRLESELDDTRDSLRLVMQQLEANNEELQSSNEELIAGNEELQATNEELQAVNEELHSINAEHFRKIEELGQLNADLENLLAAVGQVILFVDPEMRLRRWNAPAATLLGVGPRDVGTGLFSLPQKSITTYVIDNFAAVLAGETRATILSMDERQYLTRMSSATGADGTIDGVLVSITDTTAISDVVNLVSVRESPLTRLFEALPLAVASFDADGRLVSFNKAYAALSTSNPDDLRPGMTFEEVVRAKARSGLALEAVGREDAWLADRVATFHKRRPIDTVLQRGDAWYRFLDCPLPDGGMLALRYRLSEATDTNAERPVVEGSDSEHDQMIAKRLAVLGPLFERGLSAKLVVDPEGKIVMVNATMCDLCRCSANELAGKPIADVPLLRESGIPALVQTVLVTGEPMLDCALDLETEPGAARPTTFRVRLIPAVAQGKIVGVSIILQQAESHDSQADVRAIAELIQGLERDRVGLAFIDRQGRFAEVAPGLARIDGVSVEDHLGRAVHEVLPVAKKLRQPFQRASIARGEMFLARRLSLELPSHPGQARTYEVSSVPQRDAQGKIEGAHLILVPQETADPPPVTAGRRAKRG